jgi:hypothetical protein
VVSFPSTLLSLETGPLMSLLLCSRCQFFLCLSLLLNCFCQSTYGPIRRGWWANVALNVTKSSNCSFHLTSPPPYPGITLSKVSVELSGDIQAFPRFTRSPQFGSSLSSPPVIPVERGVFPQPALIQLKSQNKVRVQPSPNGRKRKLWKPNKVTKKLVLGSDIGLEETCHMALCGLVGRVSYHYLPQEPLQAWMEKTWSPILGYSSEVIFLAKGWLGFICRSPEDTVILLATRWLFGASSIMLKRWRVSFDPDTDYFPQRHLWVLLPGLPLHFWNEGALRAIGDALGTFISLDFVALKAPYRKVGKVLVELDIHGGFPEAIDIEWRGRRKKQRLDYMGIPFRCNRCHCTGHLRRDCKGLEVVEEPDEELANWDVSDCSPAVEMFGSGDPLYQSEVNLQEESTDTLSGKIKTFFLLFMSH